MDADSEREMINRLTEDVEILAPGQIVEKPEPLTPEQIVAFYKAAAEDARDAYFALQASVDGPVTVDSPRGVRAAWIEGMRFGVEQAATLIPIYEGQGDLPGRVGRAGAGIADVFARNLDV